MNNFKRDPFFVEPKIRKAVVSRVFFYWCTFVMFSLLPLIIGTTLADPKTMFVTHTIEIIQRYWLVYLMALGFLPFAIRDALRTVNQTLGPLKRLSQSLAEFKATGNYKPVECREGDFLSELVENINAAISANKTQAANESADEGVPQTVG